MLPFDALLRHSVIYGGVLSVFMTGIIGVSFVLCPRIWIESAPADVRAAAGRLTIRDRRAKQRASVLVLVGLVTILTHSVLTLRTLAGGSPSFIDVAISIFLIAQVFNLVDLLLIDWLLIATIRPSFVVFPGTEHLAGYADYGFYARGFVKGLIGSAVVSLVVAGVTVGVLALLH